MPLENFACQPSADPALLHALTVHSCTPTPQDGTLRHDTRRRWTRHRLAANPRTPAADLTTLLDREPDLIRDVATHTSADQLVGHLAGRGTQVLIDALQTSPDPDGTLARYALTLLTASTPALSRRLLANTDRTPPEVQRAAALALAAHSPLSKPDVDQLTHIACTQPATRSEMLAVAVAPQLITALRRSSTPGVGTPDWYSHHASSTEALTNLEHNSTPTHWRVALTHAPDPTSAIADAAITAHAGAAHLMARIATTTTDPHVIRRAITAYVHTHKPVPDNLRRAVVPHLAAGSDSFAVTYAPRANTHNEFEALLMHPTLPVEVLDLIDNNVTHLRKYTTYQHGMLDPALWGAALATHPNATPAQRQHGADLAIARAAAERASSPRSHSTGNSELSVQVATIGLSLPTTTAAQAGRNLPMDVLRNAELHQIPPVAALITAALSDSALSSAHDIATLIALAPTFTGTLGELLTTVTTLGS